VSGRPLDAVDPEIAIGDPARVRLRSTASGVAALVLASCGGGGPPSVNIDGATTDTAPGGDGAADPALTLRTGLAGAWSFDGDGKDRSGHALDLDVVGFGFPTGRFGKGVQFLGEGTKIAQRPISDPSLDLATGDFTVSFWVNFVRTGSPQFVAIKGYGEGGWFVGWAQTVWAFGFPAPTGATFADPADSPATGVFHQVVFERSGDTAQFFVDGKLLGGVSVKDTAAPSPAPFQVGGYAPGGVGSGQSAVFGIVDDVAIWHRALDDNERSYLRTHAVPPS
jgi:hypothetical protein